MEQNALIIFVKNPVAGKVKTRLAQTIGAEKALQVYMELLKHTRTITSGLTCDKFVFYDGHIEIEDEWNAPIFRKETQMSGDLGSKMQHAFSKLFGQGYSKIVIIGSDCYELDAEIIESAFAALESIQIVIGPAIDGGYYLLGSGKLIDALFHDISWSSSAVLEQTINILHKKNERFVLLPMLSDVDKEDDLNDKLRRVVGLSEI